jgi:hypothetical protein
LKVAKADNDRHLQLDPAKAFGDQPFVDLLVKEAADFVVDLKHTRHYVVSQLGELVRCRSAQVGVDSDRHGKLGDRKIKDRKMKRTVGPHFPVRNLPVYMPPRETLGPRRALMI